MGSGDSDRDGIFINEARALIPVVITLWLALGVFIIFPFIKLLLVTFRR